MKYYHATTEKTMEKIFTDGAIRKSWDGCVYLCTTAVDLHRGSGADIHRSDCVFILDRKSRGRGQGNVSGGVSGGECRSVPLVGRRDRNIRVAECDMDRSTAHIHRRVAIWNY